MFSILIAVCKQGTKLFDKHFLKLIFQGLFSVVDLSRVVGLFGYYELGVPYYERKDDVRLVVSDA